MLEGLDGNCVVDKPFSEELIHITFYCDQSRSRHPIVHLNTHREEKEPEELRLSSLFDELEKIIGEEFFNIVHYNLASAALALQQKAIN